MSGASSDEKKQISRCHRLLLKPNLLGIARSFGRYFTSDNPEFSLIFRKVILNLERCFFGQYETVFHHIYAVKHDRFNNPSPLQVSENLEGAQGAGDKETGLQIQNSFHGLCLCCICWPSKFRMTK